MAEVFRERSAVRRGEVLAAVSQAPGFEDPVAAAQARRSLSHLGFLWRAGAMPEWEPGIPSLMDYIRLVVPAP